MKYVNLLHTFHRDCISYYVNIMLVLFKERRFDMTDKEKLNQLEELLDIEKGTLSEDTELHQINEWDSMAIITIIAMFDEVYGKIITPANVKNFKTIKDVMGEME
jgi:acyl carrier protein